MNPFDHDAPRTPFREPKPWDKEPAADGQAVPVDMPQVEGVVLRSYYVPENDMVLPAWIASFCALPVGCH